MKSGKALSGVATRRQPNKVLIAPATLDKVCYVVYVLFQGSPWGAACEHAYLSRNAAEAAKTKRGRPVKSLDGKTDVRSHSTWDFYAKNLRG